MINENVRDFTEGNIVKNIWILALPMLIEMVMQSTFDIIDLFWVGRLGPEAIASVALAGVILMVFFSMIMGIATSCSALVARRIGAKDNEGANFIIIQAIYLGVIMSIFFGYIGFDNAKFFITKMGASLMVIKEGTLYLKFMFAGSIGIVLLFIINGIFRGVGDAKEAMYVLLVSNILNIIIDPLLIFGIGPFPKMGVKGAALATVLARFFGIGYQFYILINGTGRIKLTFKKLGINFGIIWKIIKIGIPASGQLLLRMFGMLIIMRIVALFGTFAIAAYGIATRLFQFILFPGFGLGNASATLVGQNLGAGNPKRAEYSAWITGLITMVLFSCCAVIFFVFAATLIRIFNDDTTVISFGVTCLRIISISYLINGLGVVLSRAFMGAGDTISPFVINGLTLWLLQIPLAFVLAKPFDLGIIGIWVAICLSNITNALMSAVWFKVGRWKYKMI